MLEDYIKRLESLITPNNYNKNNFRQKIKTDLEDPEVIENKNFSSKNKREFLLELDKNNITSEENKKLLDEYLNKMGIRDLNDSSISTENKLKIYQKILEKKEINNPANVAEDFAHTYGSIELSGPIDLKETKIRDNKDTQSVISKTNKTNKTYSLSPSRRIRMSGNFEENEINGNVGSLREKIHLLNIKNMNYRHEVESLKTKISELSKTIEEKSEMIEKLEKQKENSNRYLLKLEAMLAQNGTKEPQNYQSFIQHRPSQLNFSNNSINNFPTSPISKRRESNFIDYSPRKSTKTGFLSDGDKFTYGYNSNYGSNHSSHYNTFHPNRDDIIANLVNENQKLKSFQNQVFEISKNYDDINENMVEGMKKIQQIINLNEIDKIDTQNFKQADADKREINGKIYFDFKFKS